MKKIFFALLLSLSIIGCSGDTAQSANVAPALTVGADMSNISLNDQFEKKHTLKPKTTKLIFAFSKDVAHTCNDFFATKKATYLQENNTEFIADVSAAPSLIRSMFIMPGLKDFKHIVLVLEDKTEAAPYRAGADVEKIVVVFLKDKKITKIESLSSDKELATVIEAK